MDFNVDKALNMQQIHELLQQETEHMAAEGYRRSKKANFFREITETLIEIYSDILDNPYLQILALSYVDRFASRRPHMYECKDSTIRQVIVMCSILLAVRKITGDPAVEEEFLSKEINEENLNLTTLRMLRRFERLIPKTLNWKMDSITAVSFVDHFLYLLQIDDPDLKTRAMTGYFFRMYKGIKFTRFRPSVIAATYILASYSLHPRYIFFKATIRNFVKKVDLKSCMVALGVMVLQDIFAEKIEY